MKPVLTVRTLCLILLATVGLPTMALAQEPPLPPAQGEVRDNLETIFRDALTHDPIYAAARFTQQAALESVPQARAALLPQLAASVRYTYTDYQSETPNVSRTFSNWGPALTLTVPLLRAQNWTAVSQAQFAITQATASLAQARQDLVLRVAQAYFDVLTAEDQLTAIGADKKAIGEQLAQAKREFEVGTKTIVDTHEAQARYDQIVAQEQVARGDLIVKRNALRTIIGRNPGTLVPLTAEPALTAPTPSDVEAWATRAEETSHNVTVAQAAARIAQYQTKRARQGHWPTLDLTAQVAKEHSTGSSLNNTDNTADTGSVGVTLNVPIYSGGLTQSQVRESLALEQKAQFDLENARRSAAQAARQFYTGVNFGLAQVRALESAEISAQSQLDSTRLGYQVGVRIALDVLNATTQVYATQRDLKKARYDFIVNGLRLKSATGELTDADIQSVNRLLHK